MNAKFNADTLRPAPWWLFVSLLAATVLMTVLGNYWFIPSGVWKPLDERSYGLVNATLIWGLAYFLVVICGILLIVGRRTPTEVGIERAKIPAAIIYTCVLWILVQLGLGLCYVGVGKPLHFANSWNGAKVLSTVGDLLGQLFGNALCEEIVFRGFLLTQCLLLFYMLWPERPTRALVVALWLATAIFTVLHVPYQLTPANYSALSKLACVQVEIFFSGCVFGWIYWQTGNVFFAAGVHALANEPTTLFVWHDLGLLTRGDPVVLLIAVGIAAAWHLLPATDRRASH